MKKSYFVLTMTILWASLSSAGLLFNYSQLTIKDLDQINAMVNKKVKEYKKERSVEILKEAVQAVYSRPNDDAMVEKVIQPLRNELDENDLWEGVMDELVQEAIGALKNPKAFKPIVQNTYAIFLENVISDFKPFADKPGHERTVLEKIRDAKIEMTKEAINERKLRTMKNNKSPSEIATQMLENIARDEGRRKEAEAAAAASAATASEAKEKEKKKP